MSDALACWACGCAAPAPQTTRHRRPPPRPASRCPWRPQLLAHPSQHPQPTLAAALAAVTATRAHGCVTPMKHMHTQRRTHRYEHIHTEAHMDMTQMPTDTDMHAVDMRTQTSARMHVPVNYAHRPCALMHTCMHRHTDAHMHADTDTHNHKHMHAHMDTCALMHTYTDTQSLTCMNTWTHTCVLMHTHVGTHTDIYAQIHRYIRDRAHMHAHMDTCS